MQGQADREVLFTLRAVTADDAQQAFSRMATMAERANAQMLQSAEAAADNWAKAWARAADRMAGTRQQVQERAASRTAAAEDRALARQQANESKAMKAKEREEERARKAAEREREKQFKADVALMQAAAKEEKRRWEEEKKSIESAAKAESDAREKAQRAQEKASRAYESAAERQRSMAMQSKMAVAELGEGVTRMGRGIAQLGILSEETTEGLVRGFLKVQGVFDIAAGGIKVYRSITVMVDSYRKSVEAAAVAEKALAAARGASAVAGGASAAGAGGAAAGGLGAFALPVAGAAALLGGAALSGRALWERSHGTRPEDSWFESDTTTAWGLGMAGKLTALDPMGLAQRTPYGKLVAERAAMAESQAATERMAKARERTAVEAAAAREAEMDRQRQLTDLFDLERQRSLSGINTRATYGGIMTEAARRRAELEATRPGFDATEQQRGEYALAERQLERELALQQQRTGAEADLAGARGVFDIESGAFRQSRTESAAAREALSGAMSRGGSLIEVERLRAVVEETAKAEEDAASRLAAANEQRIQQEERIAGIRQQSAEIAIQKTQEEMALREEMIERDRQRLMTAAERIAGMTGAEQEQYGQLLQKARAGGELTAEEYRKLGTVDLEETRKLREQYTQRMAAGFFETYGIGEIERNRMAENKRLEEELQVRLKDERKIAVDVQLDGERIVREVTEAARGIIDERMGRAIDEIKRNLEGDLTRIDRQRSESAQARRSVIR